MEHREQWNMGMMGAGKKCSVCDISVFGNGTFVESFFFFKLLMYIYILFFFFFFIKIFQCSNVPFFFVHLLFLYIPQLLPPPLVPSPCFAMFLPCTKKQRNIGTFVPSHVIRGLQRVPLKNRNVTLEHSHPQHRSIVPFVPFS